MQKLLGKYVKHPAPSQSENIVPYRPSPEPEMPGALIVDDDGDIFVSRSDLEGLLQAGECPWDLSDLIYDIDAGEQDGCFNGESPKTVLISIPYRGLSSWLSEALARPLHRW